MIVADVIDREHGSVFLRVPSFRPKARKICGSLRRYAQHHHRGAFIVVNQRPEFTASVPKRPFRYNIFSRFRVALRGTRIDEQMYVFRNTYQTDRARNNTITTRTDLQSFLLFSTLNIELAILSYSSLIILQRIIILFRFIIIL